MGRKIVLLSDGTGNSAAKIWRTNVWRTFERLDLSGDDQVAYYDDGVGTSEFRFFAAIAGAFGYGLKRNVIDLYKFACRNHRASDDEIYGFGFSRGAFTIRVVTGLILDQGLVRADSEPELHRMAIAAYRTYRAQRFRTRWVIHPESLFRGLRDLLSPVQRRYKALETRRDFTVRFLGLWDTVAAYGMPIEVMTRGINDWIWPLELPTTKLDARVKRACHALAIDDERASFHPVLWNECDGDEPKAGADGSVHLSSERISQVWFAGAHANVGGGYPDDSLAHISLHWILEEARKQGLKFKQPLDANPQTLEHTATARDKDGRLYDPRGGFGAYYRYSPRDIATLMKKQNCKGTIRIHQSVFSRIDNRAHAYAPVGLPGEYKIATWDGCLVDQNSNDAEDVARGTARAAAQQAVWDQIAFRRVLYVLTVLATAYFVLYPLFAVAPPDIERASRLRWLSELVKAVGSFLPDAVSPWIEGYAQHPGVLLTGVAILSLLFVGAGMLRQGIRERMDGLWRSKELPKTNGVGAIRCLREDAAAIAQMPLVKGALAPVLSAIIVVYVGLAVLNRWAFNMQDYAGWTCPETPPRPGRKKLEPMQVGDVIVDRNRTMRYDDFKLHAAKNPLLSAEQRKNPFEFVKPLPSFSTNRPCQGLGVLLAQSRSYYIRFEDPITFKDGGIAAAKGFYAADARPLWRATVMFVGTPLKRSLRQKWFTVTARIGSAGAEEEHLLPEDYAVDDLKKRSHIYSTCITPRTSGELYLYVNDAVIGIPGLYDIFYRNNEGATKVLVRQVPSCR